MEFECGLLGKIGCITGVTAPFCCEALLLLGFEGLEGIIGVIGVVGLEILVGVGGVVVIGTVVAAVVVGTLESTG